MLISAIDVFGYDLTYVHGSYVMSRDDLGRPDFGEPVPFDPKAVPVFWACGVTPQAVAETARIELMITHEPGQMFLTDLPRDGV